MQIIRARLGETLPANFEIIIDYKGMRRPNQFGMGKRTLWEQYEWQVQTYAELRRKQQGSKKVVAGVLLYVNELAPTRQDIDALRQEMRDGITDVAPEAGSELEATLRSGKIGTDAVPFHFRLKRALHVVTVNEKTIANALTQFDQVVLNIETCRGKEHHGQRILACWDRNPADVNTCEVCDARTYCPDFQSRYAARLSQQQPQLPGQKPKP